MLPLSEWKTKPAAGFLSSQALVKVPLVNCVLFFVEMRNARTRLENKSRITQMYRGE